MNENLNPAQFSESHVNPANGAPAEGPDPYSGMPVNEY